MRRTLTPTQRLLLAGRSIAGGTGVETALIIGAVAAAAATTAGVVISSQAQAAAADYNADAARQQAQQATDAAKLAEEESRERNRRLQATARSRASASGVVTSEGSPLLVLMDSAAQAEMEAQAIRYGGATRAAGFQSEAGLQGFQARQARQSGAIGAGVSLLSSGVGIGTQAYGFQQKKLQKYDYGYF